MSCRTIPVKKGQNAPSKTALYNCNSVAPVPRAVNRKKMKLAGAPCDRCRAKRRKAVIVVIANGTKTTNAIQLHHLQTPVRAGSMVRNTSAIVQRPSGRIELASKSRSRNLSSVDHSCTDSRRKATTTPAKPASATAICAAVLRASPGSIDRHFIIPWQIAEELFFRSRLRQHYFANTRAFNNLSPTTTRKD
jgi:hypothetical protein